MEKYCQQTATCILSIVKIIPKPTRKTPYNQRFNGLGRCLLIQNLLAYRNSDT
jgi:hypothetical protein